jgi:hypothetical protein
MAIKKKKISELTLSDNLKGLYTIGVKLINGVQTSVKVSLEYIQTAYENAVKATNSANEAAKSANNAASSANTATSNANKATEAAKTATNNANEATQQAKTATSNANLATQKANTAATNADNARKGLEEIKSATESATANANKAANNANTQANRAKEQADNPPKMGENGNWWKWDETQKKYVDTGILAKGGILYPTFTIDPDTMELIMYYQDDIAADMFDIDNEGFLIFNPK